MKYEIREGSVIIDGYVNAVDRFSKTLYDSRGKFIEKVMPSVFQRAIEKADNIDVFLNHDKKRKLADTKSGKAKLYEDNIGLRAIVETSDEEVKEKAENGELRGWSFGFICKKQKREAGNTGVEERTIRELDLLEVSIIDNRKTPAYIATSIELRDDEPQVIEYREEDMDLSNEDLDNNTSNTSFLSMTASQKREILTNAVKKISPDSWLEDFDDKYVYATVDETRKVFKMAYTLENNDVNIDFNNKIGVIRGGYTEIRDSSLASVMPEQQPKKVVEKIDYSNYKERLKKIKGGN